jgi:hypothetical protein
MADQTAMTGSFLPRTDEPPFLSGVFSAAGPSTGYPQLSQRSADELSLPDQFSHLNVSPRAGAFSE